MYKNFKITEEERLQILESHMSHGYKKPLNEEMSPENAEFFKKQRQSAVDNLGNSDSKTLFKDKFISKLNSLVYEFEYQLENLMEDAFEESDNQMDLGVETKFANMIISKLDETKDKVKSEYLAIEPNDDQIMNQPGSEGGVSYKSDDDNFQGR